MTVLFVCTGNTCRSPMAEGFFNLLCKPHDRALSCGLYVHNDVEASAHAITAAAEHGADISAHIPKQHTAELVAAADFIYCVTPAHAQTLCALYPDAEGKIKSLFPPISDPYGQDLEVYRACATELFEAAQSIAEVHCETCKEDEHEGESPDAT